MTTIILTRGIQGSGKSTWSKQWVNECPEKRIRWNNDDYRLMLGPYNCIKQREKIVVQCRLYTILSAIENNYDIVIDATNIKINKSINSITNFLTKHNISNDQYNIIVKEFDTPLNICMERVYHRNKNGNIYISEQVIKNTYNSYINYNNPQNNNEK